MKKTKPNPNGVNQYTGPDPRSTLFLKKYLDPKSDTFSNAFQSALAAGYSEEYAKVITTKELDWLSESVRDNDMIARAERNLSEALDLPTMVPAMGPFGPIYEMKEVKVKQKNGKIKIKKVRGAPIMVYSSSLIKHKIEVTEFVAERLQRKKYGKEDKSLVVPIQVNINQDREAYA